MGSLVYVTLTRIDISYAVEVLSQFVVNPYRIHHTTLLHVIQYVHGFISQGVFFPSDSSIHLEGYAGVDLAGCLNSVALVGVCFLIHS